MCGQVQQKYNNNRQNNINASNGNRRSEEFLRRYTFDRKFDPTLIAPIAAIIFSFRINLRKAEVDRSNSARFVQLINHTRPQKPCVNRIT